MNATDLPMYLGAGVKVTPRLFEYAEARSLGDVNGLAAQGWRVHTALLVPASAAKLYLMERERT